MGVKFINCHELGVLAGDDVVVSKSSEVYSAPSHWSKAETTTLENCAASKDAQEIASTAVEQLESNVDWRPGPQRRS